MLEGKLSQWKLKSGVTPRSVFGSKHVNVFVGVLGIKIRRELVKLA